jgi:hypothetical protein
MIDTSITVIYHAMSVTVLYIFKQTIPDDPDPNEADSKGMPDDQEPVKYMFKIPYPFCIFKLFLQKARKCFV